MIHRQADVALYKSKEKVKNQLNLFTNTDYIAGAMALTNIPYLTKDVDNSFGMAIGTYRGETALAGGIQRQLSPRINARVSLTWDSSQAVGVAGGLAVGW